MRIAISIYNMGGGGAERTAVVLANNFVKKGIDTYILTGPVAKDDYELDPLVTRVVLFKKNSVINDAFRLHNFLCEEHIDICVSLGVYSNFVSSFSNMWLKAHIVIYEQNSPKDVLLSWKSKILRRLLYRRANAYVFQTPDERSYYSKSIQKRGVVIPNPLMKDLPHRNMHTKKEIVAIGRLTSQKNYAVLLRAFSIVHNKYPDYILRIFGKGKLEVLLKKIAQDLGIYDSVIFEGYTLNIHDKIVDSDIYVLSSDFEGMPNTLMEAMGMGFPVVSTDCGGGGPRMLINSGINGLLVPRGNPEALSEAIIDFIEKPELKEDCATNAYKSIYNICSLDKVVNQWLIFFNQLCGN